ncbi:hypothetical protein [Alteromonas sp. H39]|uniref:hypothetical protein n=1 Tax=Alteromonas sp. H39 TaxID=3389876 RepID=UPI0039E15A0B
MKYNILPVLLAAFALSACGEDDQADSAPTALQPESGAVETTEIKEEKAMEKSQSITGSIVYKDMEGGFYALVTESGEHYTLQGLDKKYHQNGLVVKVTGQPMPDVMTITMFGTVFKVADVEIISDAMVKPINPTH